METNQIASSKRHRLLTETVASSVIQDVNTEVKVFPRRSGRKIEIDHWSFMSSLQNSHTVTLLPKTKRDIVDVELIAQIATPHAWTVFRPMLIF